MCKQPRKSTEEVSGPIIARGGWTLTVPADCLPEDSGLRHTWLQKIFSDHEITNERVAEGWAISLRWPCRAEHYVDPRLHEGLAWWSPETSVEAIPLAVRRRGRWQLSLHDSWSLWSWSRWLTRRVARGERPREVVVLHVDEHDDLNSPFLWICEGIWRDGLTGRRVDLQEPAKVRAAIHSGAIGIKSFIVPLLHMVNRVDIRHLGAPGRRHTGRFHLQHAPLEDPVIAPWAHRPSVRLERDDTVKEHDSGRNWYTITTDMAEWLRNLPKAPILLHLDLDFFNNRFNGSADWRLRSPARDPDEEEIALAVDALFDHLRAAKVLPWIEDISVALSPGFFPAELWAPVTTQIERWIKKLFAGASRPRGKEIP